MSPKEKLYVELQHQETRNDVAAWACLIPAWIQSYSGNWAIGVGFLLAGLFFAILSVKTARLRKRLESLMESEAQP